jgi:hypothetical protein
MNTRRLLIASFVFLAAGVYLLCAFCHGSTGFQASDTISANSVKIDIATTGWPALAGTPLTIVGLLLLMISFVAAIIGEIRAPRTRRTPSQLMESGDPKLL